MKNRTQADIDLIWKHTHPDFKGECAIEKNIMTRGSIGPISTLPEKTFCESLRYAKRKEIRVQRDRLLKPLFERFNINSAYLTSTDQGRDTLEDVISIIKYTTDGQNTLDAIKAIKAANIIFIG